MTNSAQQHEPPLPPPYRVPNAPLDLKFAMMTPDQIRRFVREEAIAERDKYDVLFAAAKRALGPESPEALLDASIAGPPVHRLVADSIDYLSVTTAIRSINEGPGPYCIETRTEGGCADTLRVPTKGWLDRAPTMAEVIEAHLAAMLIIAQTIKDRKEAIAKAKAEAEQAKAAPAETPAAS